jgi:hypothetical protein
MNLELFLGGKRACGWIVRPRSRSRGSKGIYRKLHISNLLSPNAEKNCGLGGGMIQETAPL